MLSLVRRTPDNPIKADFKICADQGDDSGKRWIIHKPRALP